MAIVARINSVETHPDADLQHLSVSRVLDKVCISGKSEDGSHRFEKDELVVFVPLGEIFNLEFQEFQGDYWDIEKQRGLLKGSKRNRVGPVTRGSVTSEGILLPLSEYDDVLGGVLYTGPESQIHIKEGDDLTEILGFTKWSSP